ncbi:hypothetical protein GCM10025787_22910 [Saccharopolyspora rosea]
MVRAATLSVAERDFAKSAEAIGLSRVRQLLPHAAGLPYPQRAVSREMAADHPAVAALLAEQAPLWPVGSRVAYHALTSGWLAAELVRQVDGRSITDYVRAEITERIPADGWLGPPAEHSDRTGRCRRAPDYSNACTARRAAAPTRERDVRWSSASAPNCRTTSAPAVRGGSVSGTAARAARCTAAGRAWASPSPTPRARCAPKATTDAPSAC